MASAKSFRAMQSRAAPAVAYARRASEHLTKAARNIVLTATNVATFRKAKGLAEANPL